MFKKSRAFQLIAFLAALFGSVHSHCLVMGQEVDFARDVWPILESRCHGCHAGDWADGQLRLDAREPFFAGGISGPAVVGPADRRDEAELGTLLARLTTEDPEQRMPLDDDPLSAAEIDAIRRWVEQGADWPESIGEQISVERHWAYQPPTRVATPQIERRDWPRNAIDYFILAKLEEFGQRPSPEAEEARLVRRVYLDLIGLPPTVEQLDHYFGQPAPVRYEQLVDQLLASPRYGERWARPWLDAARYADSNGYQADQYREVWAYRDWVIRAFNQDLPFDQFTIEQVAGDLLPNATVDQKIATGFQRLTTCNVEAGVDPEENRINQIVDRVNTTGTVWLGTTLECAQCHHHKYDPFSQEDYYSLFAYFNQTPLEVEDSGNTIQFEFVGPKMSLPLSDKEKSDRLRLEAKLTQLKQQQEELRQELLTRFPEWLTQLESRLAQPGAWQSFDEVSIQSENGTQFQELDDRSFVSVGDAPNKDIYRFTGRVAQGRRIHAIRLETLTHDALPGRGPGRSSAEKPNFILNELIVRRVAKASKGQQTSIALNNAFADFSQSGWPVSATIDGNPNTGWGINPQFHKDHWAVFVPQDPIDLKLGEGLEFELVQQHGDARTIGRLRLTFSESSDDAVLPPPGNIAAVVKKPATNRTMEERTELEEYFLGQESEWTTLNASIEQQRQDLQGIAPATTLVMVESEERDTFVLNRGDFLAPGAPVEPRTPKVLPSLPEDAPNNRLALAQWLVSPAQPLTARVVVNRWWSELFGRGIVATLEDFGTQGEPPTHPELLDWLAVELMEHDWSMKHIHRLIVTSSTYRQTSRSTAAQREWDPHNQWYGRSSRFRLPAETIRDNALTIAGQLSTDMYGEPIYPPQPSGVWRHVGRNAPKYETSTGGDRFRRGVYVIWRRSAPYPSFVNFDAPDRASCVVERPRTNTPLQALTLMNDPANVELARALAQQIAGEFPAGCDWAEVVSYSMRRSVARQPNSRELSTLIALCEREYQLWMKSRDDLSVGKSDEKQRQAELAAIEALATVLMNLDETITRE